MDNSLEHVDALNKFKSLENFGSSCESELSFELSPEDLKNVVYGACFFASGGGGPISMAEEFLKEITGPVKYINPNQLAAGKMAVILADMGSPDAVAAGRGFTAPVNVYQTIASYMKSQGKDIEYIMPIELGAVNTLIPFYIAFKLGNSVPVINADPSGRAVPQLNETLLDVAGEAICPAAVASDTQTSNHKCAWSGGQYLSQMFFDLSATELEAQSRVVVSGPGYDQVGGLACYPIDGAQLNSDIPANRDKLIQGSVGLSWFVGQLILSQVSPSVLSECLGIIGTQNYQWMNGTITDIDNRTSGGFDVGKIILSDGTDELWVYYKNESLLAWKPITKQPLAMGPDGISLMQSSSTGETGLPVSTAGIAKGDQYSVWGFAISEKMRNNSTVELFQQNIDEILAAFPEDNISITGYIPIEQLN